MNNDLLRKVKFPSQAWWRRWSVVLLMGACCLVLETGGDPLRTLCRYDRVAIENGEWWRLVTGHLVHLGWGHLWPNLLALAVIGSLFDDVLRPLEWLAASVAAAFAIDLGLYIFDPEVDWYVGLSGVLHGLVACGALLLLRRRNPIGWLLVLGIGGKLLFEQIWGPVPLTAASVGGPVIVAAHFYGAAAGVASAACFAALRRRDSRL